MMIANTVCACWVLPLERTNEHRRWNKLDNNQRGGKSRVTRSVFSNIPASFRQEKILPCKNRLSVQLKKRTLLLLSYFLDYS
jgi:hypothetical protein